MEVREVVQTDEVVMEDMVEVEDACERIFEVRGLVEFWAGPVVRAYRTDSGEPTYVKEIYGLGWYGINMVGRGEMVRLAAEAKFEDALRASQRDLSKAERQQEALKKEVEERL